MDTATTITLTVLAAALIATYATLIWLANKE